MSRISISRGGGMLGDGIDPVLLCHIPDEWLSRLTVRLAPDIPTRAVVTVTNLSEQLHRHPLSTMVIGLPPEVSELRDDIRRL